jgi:hypothetical protein
MVEHVFKVFSDPIASFDPGTKARNAWPRPLVATRGILYLGGNRLEAPLAFAMNGARIVVNGRSLPAVGTQVTVLRVSQDAIRVASIDANGRPEIVAVPGPIPIHERNVYDQLDDEAVRASFALRAALESLARGELVVMSRKGLAFVPARDASAVDYALQVLQDCRNPDTSQWQLLADTIPNDMLSELEEPVRLEEVGK